MIDIAIIGAGPAGLSAAINGVARNKTVAVFGNKKDTSAIYKSKWINNHLGMPEITGEEMMDRFYKHAESVGVKVGEGRVFQIMQMGGYYSVNFENEFYEAKTVILAVGTSKGSKVKGEDEYLGLGVSYCATCDGMLYRGKDVLIVGEIEEGDSDANFLSGICNKVYYLPKHGRPKNISDKIEVIDGRVTEIIGDEYVTGANLGDRMLECEGIFFIKKTPPLSSLIYGMETEDNLIKVNRRMETNLAGVYACGDCIGWPYQISSAIGNGLIAAQQAAKYIESAENRNGGNE